MAERMSVPNEHAPELIERVQALFVGAPIDSITDLSGEAPDEEGRTPFAETLQSKSGIDLLTGVAWILTKHDILVELPNGQLTNEQYCEMYEVSDPDAFWVLDLRSGELASSEEIVDYRYGQAARFSMKLALIEEFDTEHMVDPG